MTIVKFLSSLSLFLQLADLMSLHNDKSSKNIQFNSSIPTTMTSSHDIVDFPIASTRLRSLILKKHMSTLYTQLTQEKMADPHLTRMILLNMFQIFQINKITFAQYLKLHNHPDTFIQKCDAMTHTDNTTIRQKPFLKNLSNRTRTPIEKEKLVSYWPTDDNDSTDDELQKDLPEAFLNQNSPYKIYTYIAF